MRAEAKTLRLFFALWPPAAIRAQLAQLAARCALGAGRPVPAENYHVTLAFAGAVMASDLQRVREIGAVQRAARCMVSLDWLEYWGEGKVLAAVADHSPAPLEALSADLYAKLQRIAAQARAQPALRVHVTLAREAALTAPRQALTGLCWTATEFALLRSHTDVAHSLYTVLDTWPLLDTR